MNSPHEKTEYAIEVQNLSMRFGQDTVVKNVSCKLQAGQIHGLIGRNGSGKTVLMKCILGFLRPSSARRRCLANASARTWILPRILAC